MRFALIVVLLVACGDGDDELGPGRCELAAWRADSDCDAERACGFTEPDPGCYVTLQSADEAIAWYDKTYARKLKGPALPPSDPRFAPTQAIVDEAWEHYKATHPIGTLVDRRIQLILVEEGKPNAFVSGDGSTIKTGLAVLITASLVDLGIPREQMLAVIAHELEHAIGLHTVSAVAERMQRYYVAGATTEPAGFEQEDDPTVRGHAMHWLEYADNIGHHSDVELDGLPIYGDLGDAFRGIVERRTLESGVCDASKLALDELYRSITPNPLDDAITLDAAGTQRIATTMAKLRDECFAGVPDDAIALVADHFDIDEDRVRASLSAEYKQGIEHTDFITGITYWVKTERAAMREIEAEFEVNLGEPWSRMRYFSTEEAADDSSVYTMHASGFAADTLGKIVPVLGRVEAQCRPLVDGNLPIPYGEDLTDDHHAPCWRAGHVKRIAQRVTPRLIDRPPLAAPTARPEPLFPRRNARVSH